MISYAIDALKPLVTEIIIIANNPTYQEFDLPVYADLFPDKGPLGGICTGLEYSKTERNIVLSCDTPFVTTEVLEHLYNESRDAKIAISVMNVEQHPLVGIYSKSLQNNLEAFIESGQLSLMRILPQMEFTMINFHKELPFFHPKLFYNINHPGNLEDAESFSLPDA